MKNDEVKKKEKKVNLIEINFFLMGWGGGGVPLVLFGKPLGVSRMNE